MEWERWARKWGWNWLQMAAYLPANWFLGDIRLFLPRVMCPSPEDRRPPILRERGLVRSDTRSCPLRERWVLFVRRKARREIEEAAGFRFSSQSRSQFKSDLIKSGCDPLPRDGSLQITIRLDQRNFCTEFFDLLFQITHLSRVFNSGCIAGTLLIGTIQQAAHCFASQVRQAARASSYANSPQSSELF